jgi:hypothetical protein
MQSDIKTKVLMLVGSQVTSAGPRNVLTTRHLCGPTVQLGAGAVLPVSSSSCVLGSMEKAKGLHWQCTYGHEGGKVFQA